MFIVTVCFCLGCKEKNVSPSMLNGDKYELRSFVGGRSMTKYPAGNGRIIVFSNNTYHEYYQDTLVSKGIYQIEKKHICKL